MKHAFIIFTLLIGIAFAVPQQLTYQAKLTDAAGVALNGTYSLTFAMYDTAASGTALWTETQDIDIDHGLFSVNLGTVAPLDLPFDDEYWLQIAIDGTPLVPRMKLTSSGYAFRAAIADSVAGGADGWVDDGTVVHLETGTDNVGIGTTSPKSALHVNGTITVPWGFKFQHYNNYGVGDPDSIHTFLCEGWSGTDGDFLYIGSSGNRPNTSQGAIVISENVTKFGKGTDAGNDLSTEYMRINLINGNVGIGTTTPSDKFEIHDGSLFIEGDDNGAFRIGQGTDFYQMIIDYDANDEGSALYFQANGADRVYIGTNGNMGIGTTLPGAKLDISGIASDSRGIYIHDASGTGDPDTGIVIRDVAYIGLKVDGGGGNGVNISSSGGVGLRISESGDAGIEISDPDGAGVRVVNPGNDGFDLWGGTETTRGLYIHDASGIGDPDTGIVIRNVADHGIYIDQPGGNGMSVYGAGSDGLDILFPVFDGLYVVSPGGDGLEIQGGSSTERGIYIHNYLGAGDPDTGIVIWDVGYDGISIGNPGEDGVEIMGGTTTGRGLYIHDYSDIGDPDTGIVIRDVADHGVYVDSPGGDGVKIYTPDEKGVNIYDPGGDGVYIYSAGGDGVSVNSSIGNGLQINSTGGDGIDISYPGTNGIEIGGGTDTKRGIYIHDYFDIGDPDTGIVIRDVAYNGINIDDPGIDGISINSPGGDGIDIRYSAGYGVRIGSPDLDGVYIDNPGVDGVEIQGGSSTERGIYIHQGTYSSDPDTGIVIREAGQGIFLDSPSGYGMNIYSPGGNGLRIGSSASDAIYITSPSGDGVHVSNAGNNGIYISNSISYGLRIQSPNSEGIFVSEADGHGIYVDNASVNGLYVYSADNDGIYVLSSTAYDGYFNYDIYAATANAGIKSFLIDHPLDPEHKLLRHYSTESPEVLVTYRGKVELDASGQGIITMPGYFPALTDENGVTVHLTPIGREPFLVSYEWDAQSCEVHVYGKPNGEASYQVIAQRDDPVKRYLYQPVESNKADGKYCPDGELLLPEAYGYPESRRRNYEQYRRER